MRVENWHPEIITAEIELEAMNRLERAGKVVEAAARSKVTVGNSRPRYPGGPAWTERIAGTLRESIRTVRLKGDPKLNIRVYAGVERSGDKLTAYYAQWVEFGTVHMPAKPFLRSAFNAAKSAIMAIMENG